jgi:radical SAM superfamily enzyme YgiQ (UPF0313 family)
MLEPLRVLLITPPMTQLNTPYPATAYLTGFLRLHADRLGLHLAQADAALELFLRVFSRAGLARVGDTLAALPDPPESAEAFLAHAELYGDTVDAVIRYLQGRDPNLATRIAGREMLPEGPRFDALDEDGGAKLEWAFGALGIADRAKHVASLYVDDLADVIRDAIAPDFELARYGERLAASAVSFDPLVAALTGPPTLIDTMLDELARDYVTQHAPDVVGLSVPFPGNLYGALRIAQAIKQVSPHTRIALGGGYVNTELRDLAEPRLFDYVDFVTLDDGERPFLALLEHLQDRAKPLLRTFVRRGSTVVLDSDPALHDIPLRDAGTPTYAGLPLDRYVSLLEMLNPMHRLWSDGRWNKLTLAHGCYWKQCTFCDVTLDYIARYDRAPADLIVDRIEALIAETGQTGFHFVDEAAPPAGLRAMAERLIERKVIISWWGNVRFEKAFTPELAQLLARSGCVAISGGLEVASDRLLGMMKKGVTVEQVARVTRAFTDAGVMVHAYLMYGFPTETEQDTIDALERVRQLFAEGCIQSAFWHRFTATAHSPIGRAPELYAITIRPGPAKPFARNDLQFDDPANVDHDALGIGLRRALYNYMHGVGLDEDPRSWFTEVLRPPRTTVAPDLIATALASG